jgi:DDE superfamily endonuclease
MQLTHSFLALLQNFASVFTRPSFRLFMLILTGWCLSSRHRFITECIFTAGQVGIGHWSCYHRFFSHYVWSLDGLCKVLARLLVRRFCAEGPILLAADDTLCRKRGLHLFGAGMHHDPLKSSKALKVFSWGHDWVVLALLIRLPWWAPTKSFALPIAFRLYRNRQGLTKGKKAKKQNKNKAKGCAGKKRKWRRPTSDHRTRPELLVELLQLVAAWFPNRRILVCADSAYGGRSVLSHLPANVDLISQVHPQGALYAPAPPPTPGRRGPRRKKGERLADLAGWAADGKSRWSELAFDQYGLHTTLAVKTQQALYYKAGKDRLLTIVLTRDKTGKRPDHRFYCTRLDWDARQILSAYASRWALEVTFEGAKQVLGLEDPANRLPQAVQRTAPMALVLYSLVVLWFDETGHTLLKFPERPWYRRKREPSFQDMVTALRRQSWLEKFAEVLPRGGPHENWLAEVAELAARVG